MDSDKVIVTDHLRASIREIHESEVGGWQTFTEKFRRATGREWPGSWGKAYQIAQGQPTTDPEIYQALDMQPPRQVTITVPAGVSIIGEGEGLLGLGHWTPHAEAGEDVIQVNLLPIPAEEWDEHSIICPVCEWLHGDDVQPVAQWHPGQKYCADHGVKGREGKHREEFERWKNQHSP